MNTGCPLKMKVMFEADNLEGDPAEIAKET